MYQQEAREHLFRVLAKLEKGEKQEFILLSKKWGVVSKALEGLILKLAEKENLTENQLFQLDLYKEFLSISKKQVNQYAEAASEIISQNQEKAIQLGLQSTQEIIELLRVRFNRIPIEAVNNMIGLSSDGSPLYELLKKSYPETVTKLTNTLIESMALGRNPEVTARLMNESMNGNLTRALRIARTEQMNCFRETSRMQMEKSGVCSGWQRIEQDDACEECKEENGKVFSFNEPFDTHPNCRGGMLPILNT